MIVDVDMPSAIVESPAADVAAESVAALFAEQVRRRPGAIALVSGHERLTYRELDRRADQIADLLKEKNVAPEDIVALAMPRSFDAIASMLAILKVGAAYLPLETEDPSARIRFMLEDAGTDCVLTTRECSKVLPGDIPVIVLDDHPTLGAAPESDPADPINSVPLTQDQAMYVMYTSGSTGVPKGVIVTHRGVIRLVHNATYAHLDADQVILQLAPLSFDASTFEIWGALLNGGRLVLYPGKVLSFPELSSVLRDTHVTTLWLTAGLFKVIANDRISDLEGLEQLLAGGDVLGMPEVRRVLETLPRCQMINGYGPTEGTTFSCCHTVSSNDLSASSVPIGRPIGGTSAYVLDEYLNEVTSGVTGELYIGGDGLARAYLRRPALTAERFLPNPVGPSGSRMYRTGDLARWIENETLEFCGRVDRQVKVRGYRIEPAEIEAALRSHPAVQDAAVIVVEDTAVEKMIVAYVVGRSPLEFEALRGHLSRLVPAYMVPARFVHLDRLPLTANGKLDRQALAVRDELADRRTENYVPPQTAEERGIARIWEALLHVARIGRNDNFFYLGGQSLIAAQVVARVLDEFRAQLSLDALFEKPTLADFAQAVTLAIAQNSADKVAPIPPVSRAQPLSLTYGEQALWGMNQEFPDQLTFNVPLVARIRGRLNSVALEFALDALLRRHENLRTTFTALHGRPTRVIAPAQPFHLELEDFSELSTAERERKAEFLALEEARRIFDLQCGPLIRIRLILLAADDFLLLITMHHIIADGWSLRVLCDELSELYSSACGTRPALLAPLEIQFADYAAWKRQSLQGEAQQRVLKYWKSQLQNLPESLSLPLLKTSPEQPIVPIVVESFAIEAEQTIELSRFNERSRVTLFVTLFSVYLLLMNRITAQSDIVTAVPVSERERRETEALIGLFVNVILLRVDLSGNPTFEELLQRVRTVSQNGVAHQQMPTVALHRAFGAELAAAKGSPFRMFFNLDIVVDRMNLHGLEVSISPPRGELEARSDMSFDVYQDGEILRFGIGYKQGMFDPSWIRSVGGAYRSLVKQVLANPRQPLNRYTIDLCR